MTWRVLSFVLFMKLELTDRSLTCWLADWLAGWLAGWLASTFIRQACTTWHPLFCILHYRSIHLKPHLQPMLTAAQRTDPTIHLSRRRFPPRPSSKGTQLLMKPCIHI
ncbi:hypothetical protein K504DRAFT_136229 [Pleomassaria siparia CBS 279.74]|uniref:Uncharacterized protein n=1 Tax=Pleomassaria siparia CBS 279.74 TaxID=1314801 RepID=A0A6G1KLL5_9PLEO|nr:hypothetical protein K504DRAFT_136229 [Pleomassaria siparia CBS 279.74]